ncbi:MAG: T9SS type A sorting domain-containing protein [Ignavibacteriaceae bacterium]|nr:T9SS type A sorting domain-containing protein [Ignavibacteriaceae bacterium]
MRTKLFLMFAVMFILSMNVFAQVYPEVSIRDIQYQNPDSLLVYFTDDKAPSLNLDTVVVTGIVMMPPYKAADPDSGVLMYVGGGSAGFYLQDTTEIDWSGLLVLIENASSYPAFALLDSGTVITVTGRVYEYATTTQKTTELILTDFTGNEVIDFKTRPQPVELTIDSLKVLGSDENKAIAEKWEGAYVIIRNVTTFNRNTSGGFYIFDSNNLTLNVGTKSNYYYQQNAPADGTVLEYIRGYIETRSAGSGGITINPSFTSDVKVSQLPPSITNITRDQVLVTPGQNVTVTANIKDPDGTVANAKLYWRKNSGTNVEVAMTNLTDTTFQAVIPSQPDSCIIDYFLQATDNQSNTATTPSDTARSRYFYLVLDRSLTIQDVQYSPFGGGYSAYNNYEVTVSGIVTADTSDIPLGAQVIIQNGTGPWSGIRINGTETLLLNKGDDVTVTGTVIDNFGFTNITGINSPSNITVNSTGNPLPVPQSISTADISNKIGGSVSAEQWEGVLVKYSDVTVTDENADGGAGPYVPPTNYNYGEILIADTSTVNTRVELQDGNHQYHNFWDASLEFVPIRVLVGDSMDELIGIMYYTFYNYKLFPRTDADFVNYVTDVEDDANTIYEYKLAQNYPNPFNPSTKINYSIQTEGLVTLKVFNILGQEVATLVNDFKAAGAHTVNFDATKLSSGIYLYKIDSNGFTQIKKMMLVK